MMENLPISFTSSIGGKRVYNVWVTPELEKKKIKDLLRSGISIENKLIKPFSFKLLQKDKDKWDYEVIVKEGIKREVRKLIAYLGGKVHKLVRIGFGPLF